MVTNALFKSPAERACPLLAEESLPIEFQFSHDAQASASVAGRASARWIAALVRPPAHSRGLSILVVLGLCVAIGATYVAVKATITMQGFYLVPLILAVSWLGLGWGVFTAFLTAFFRMAGDYATTMLDPDYYFAAADVSRVISNRVSGLLLFLVVVVVIHELIVLSRQLEERVQARTVALRQAVVARERLQENLAQAGARERAKIGRDLHDGLGQHLTATAMAARILATRLQSRGDPAAADAREVESLVRSGIEQTRRLARGLLLENVAPEQLGAELEELAASASQQHRASCAVRVEGDTARLDVAVASHLFYIAREALANALRHGAASRVLIRLAIRADAVELDIEDNGGGLAPAASEAGGMGLHIMRQRAQLLGGSLRVVAAQGGGVRVECGVPARLVADAEGTFSR